LRWSIYWQYGAVALHTAAGGASLIAGAVGGGLGATGGSVFGPGGTLLGGAGGMIAGGALGLLLQGPSALSSFAGAASGMASIQSTQAQIAQIQNSIHMRMEELRRTSDLIEQDAQIATQNRLIAETGLAVAEQQLAIAAINARFAADIVHFMQTKLFKGERYTWMASIAHENYRILLNYAIAATWMAERALEFERQQAINIVRFDYWRAQEQGLMGADQLVTDLETLRQEYLFNQQRKHQVSKTISLAQISPIELAAFRDTGLLYLTTLEEWFDRDFPTHYLRLIKGVSVTIVALVPPTEGVKATLTQLGTTRTTLKRGSTFEKVEIKRSPERIAISSAIGATGVLFPLSPNEPAPLNPFEGSGVEGTWVLEMPHASNPVLNYETIVDVQLTIQYTALDDPARRPLLPRVYQGTANYSLNLSFADAFYHLMNPDFYADDDTTYRVRFRVDDRFLAPNQRNRRLQAITLYFERAEGSIKRPLTTLRHVEQDTTVWTNRAPNEAGLIRQETQSLSTVAGTWELSFLKDEATWLQALSLLDNVPALSDPPTVEELEQEIIVPYDLFKRTKENGTAVPAQTNNRNVLDLEWLQDILAMFEYEYTI
jgi:hypothetical protein